MSTSDKGDPLNFIKAECYFKAAEAWTGPTRIVSISETAPKSVAEPGSWHGINLTFEDKTQCVIQFIRPTLWRIRYDPTVDVADPDGYSDANTRTMIEDHMSTLVKNLDDYRSVIWITTIAESDDKKYWIFKSYVKSAAMYYKVGDGIKLYLYKDPFRIQAVRTLTPLPDVYPIPGDLGIESRTGDKVVWQTSPNTFRCKVRDQHTMLKGVVLDIVKAGHGKYIGFGEQGGASFIKRPTFMNYFNFDNMHYQQVYNQGALDTREPLYHSVPFFVDLNSNPEHTNVTAVFLDNYSQIAVDFAKTNASSVKLGTRFGAMDLYVSSADTVPGVVRSDLP